MRIINTKIFWILTIFGVFLSAVEGRRKSGKGHRTLCPRGCTRCDDVNGCTQCRRSFLSITQTGGKEVGKCVHRCPEGYFGQRGRPTNKCLKCDVPNCKSCFINGYCTECQDKFFLHGEACTAQCPNGLTPNPRTRKCEEKVDCAVGNWSPWSQCLKRGRSHSCKRGRKKRTRTILQRPTDNGKKCPRVKETRKCKMLPKECYSTNELVRRQRLDEKRKRRNQKGGKRKGRRKVLSNSAKPEPNQSLLTNKPGR